MGLAASRRRTYTGDSWCCPAGGTASESNLNDWLVGAVDKRLREEFGKLQVEINDEKSRTVDLERGECFGFLGFEFRYLRGLSGAMRPHYTPKLKKRTALVRALKEARSSPMPCSSRPASKARAHYRRNQHQRSLLGDRQPPGR
jgi:hypothetical protein